jgi:hypothetical protein
MLGSDLEERSAAIQICAREIDWCPPGPRGGVHIDDGVKNRNVKSLTLLDAECSVRVHA